MGSCWCLGVGEDVLVVRSVSFCAKGLRFSLTRLGFEGSVEIERSELKTCFVEDLRRVIDSILLVICESEL